MILPLKDKKFIFLLATVSGVIALEVLSLTGLHIPMPYAPVVFGILILSVGYKVLWNGLRALLKLKFSSISLLMLIAVVAAFYLKEYPEAAVVIALYVLGERLEDIGIESSQSALSELVSKTPKTAIIKNGLKEMPIDSIEVGTILLIKPGEFIPIDGVITSGNTTIDEAAITGEPIPKDKHEGDKVFAGTLNRNGLIEIKTTSLSVDTTFSKIVKLTFQAQATKSKSQQFIQRFSKIYTPTIIVIATGIFVIPVFIYHQDFNKWLEQAVTLLVIACPCALVISTPVAIYAAIGNASSKGILVKGGKYLEIMARIKAIALDKTRTITFGKPKVSDLIPMNVSSKEELLACAAGAELFSEHPLAEAIVDASNEAGYKAHAVHKFKSIPGKGAIAECLVCEDETIFIGKLSFIKEHQPIDDKAEKTVEDLTNQGKTSVVVSFGDGVAGIIGLTDEVKPDSKESIQAIKELGVEPVMLSGDSGKAAQYLSNQVGISKAYGGLLPEDKVEKINQLLQEYGSVAMVGDGINDAPALAQSSVGIAMGAAGSDTAIETANIALMNDKLSLIPFLIRLSRRTLTTIRFNTAGAILIKILFIALALFGYSNLVLAIAADVGVTLIVILVSLRLMKFN